MTITPDHARYLLAGATPGPWVKRRDQDGDPLPVVVSTPRGERHHIMTAEPAAAPERQQADTALIAAAPDLAQTIAGMTEEWGVEADGNSLFPVNEEFHPSGEYFTECRADAEGVRDRMAKLNPHVHYRIVRRLVGPVEVVEIPSIPREDHS